MEKIFNSLAKNFDRKGNNVGKFSNISLHHLRVVCCLNLFLKLQSLIVYLNCCSFSCWITKDSNKRRRNIASAVVKLLQARKVVGKLLISYSSGNKMEREKTFTRLGFTLQSITFLCQFETLLESERDEH